mmetsp:Transcript_2323/g.3247  ORF Transcript_2323/g.3247 Transcript_2323/m.3247 type:complete len:287 (-) Transcript_2323:12-872(-)
MITPFCYLLFLLSLLLIYLGFLILPRGFKAQYCLGSRRRYRRKRRRGRRIVVPSSSSSSRNKQFQDEEVPISTNTTTTEPSRLLRFNTPPPLKSAHNKSSMIEERVRYSLTNPPGLRLIAHGIKVRPRPVWIQLHVDHHHKQEAYNASEFQNCLTWRAELKTTSLPPEGASSLSSNTPSLGSIRKVSLDDIAGIELGQKTVALKRLSKEKSVREDECFSILTNTGTLDLQCVLSPDIMGEATSPGDVRKACLDILTSCLSSNNNSKVVRRVSSAKTNENSASTISF